MKMNENLMLQMFFVCVAVTVYGFLLMRGLSPPSDVDTQDPKWKVSDEFHPDKEYAWIDNDNEYDGWNFAHEAIKGEIEDFYNALLEVLKLETITHQQVIAASKWWDGHVEHMRNHLQNEDRVTKRVAAKRFIWPTFMQEDHAKIQEYLQKIDLHTTTLLQDAQLDRMQTMKDILYVWHQYRKFIASHLKQWEEVGMSLMRAYFTPAEVQRMSKLGRLSSKVETGAIVHYVGERRLKEAMEVQNTAHLVSQLAWSLLLNPGHQYYKKKMLLQLRKMRAVGEDV